MGSFYANITLRTTRQASVVDALQSAGREALVSELQSGCIVVYDRESEEQDIEELNRLASSLSGSCDARRWPCSTMTTTSSGASRSFTRVG